LRRFRRETPTANVAEKREKRDLKMVALAFCAAPQQDFRKVVAGFRTKILPN
jgi:hypothetical protein